MASDIHPTKGIPGWLKAVMLLTIIGALNWGLIGFFNWNLVDAILGGNPREMTSTASRVVYGLVGLAGILALIKLPRLADSEHERAEPRPVPYSR
jgi:hypothetical protein